jgi:hypothetical protein
VLERPRYAYWGGTGSGDDCSGLLKQRESEYGDVS